MNFTKKDKKLCKKYVSSDIWVRYQSLVSVDSSASMKITNTGMVSSGKSSLYNILIDSKEEYFKIGAARTTFSADSYDMGNCVLVDTPGIDVTDEDDEIAYRTIMGSDLILMIHNIKTGPLQRTEVEWLKKIVENLDDKEAVKKRLIFVCSWKDAREKEEDYGKILDTVKKMVYEITQVEIPFFDVSVKKYLAGVEKNAPALMESSNVLLLKEYIKDYMEEYETYRRSMKQSSIVKLMVDMKEELSVQRESIVMECKRNKKRIKNIYKQKQNSWKQIVENYLEIIKNFQEV